MATNFGFLPITTGGHYFISYNTEDSERVQPIAQALNSAGVPLWYDYGLEYGEEWERQIAKYIHSAKAVIMFVTNGIFAKERSYVRKEYGIADMYGVKIICVFLDNIRGRDIPEQYAGWWQDLRALHGIQASQESNEQLAGMIMYALGIHPAKNSSSSEYLYLNQAIYQDATHKPQEPAPRPSVAQTTNPVYKVGKYIKFGRYPQSGSMPEPIEWRVLEVRSNGSALIIAKHAIDNVKYNDSGKSCTWETCSLRKWLNGEFLIKAFTSEERRQILTTTVQSPDNPDFGTKGGIPTKDSIFCLSIDEAKRLFSNDEDRVATSTKYARIRGAFNGTCWWWLRSPGSDVNRAAYIDYDGSVNTRGCGVDYVRVSVRPALHVCAL